jgi:hypothetical protein
MPAPRKVCPYGSAAELQAAIAEAGGISLLADRLNVSRDMIRIWARRQFGVELTPTTITAGPAPDSDLDRSVLAALKKGGVSAGSLADLFDVAPRHIRASLERLEHLGFRVAQDEHEIILDRVAPAPAESMSVLPAAALWKGDQVRFAVISDTHGGSVAERNDGLHQAYDMLGELEVPVVYHGGDWVDGVGIYAHQVRNLAPGCNTFEGQVNHVVENFPRREGIHTYGISGNHDLEGEYGRMGADPVQAIANVRDDITYLGPYSAWVELPNGAFMHIIHGKGGMAYAKSYRLQKMAEAYESGRKPAIMAVGHFHNAIWMRHREIWCGLLGTFQGGTEFSTRLGLGAPAIGVTVIEAHLADDGSLVRFRPEWFAIFTGRHMIAA